MEKKSHYTWIIDAGHGGIDSNGHYTTAPRKMAAFPDFIIYEGVINRGVAERVYRRLQIRGIEFALVYDNVIDTSLEARVQMANSIYQKHSNCIYLAIHSNAGGGSGFEIFTSVGQTKSDDVAEIFCIVYKERFPEKKFRSDKDDGDADKEENFYVLRKTKCPAILVENLFFDNHAEAVYLMSEKGQDEIADCIVASIEECERQKPI